MHRYISVLSSTVEPLTGRRRHEAKTIVVDDDVAVTLGRTDWIRAIRSAADDLQQATGARWPEIRVDLPAACADIINEEIRRRTGHACPPSIDLGAFITRYLDITARVVPEVLGEPLCPACLEGNHSGHGYIFVEPHFYAICGDSCCGRLIDGSICQCKEKRSEVEFGSGVTDEHQHSSR